MTNGDSGEFSGTYASPPCFMHEVDPAYRGLAEENDPRQRADVMRWRKAERARLIEKRLAIPSKKRLENNEQIAQCLEAGLGPVEGLIVSAYWPFRGEPNLHPLLKAIHAQGGGCALPVVVARGAPLIFRAWSPGDPLERGVWNIPTPGPEAPVVVPDVVIAPVIGFDRACFRLGYGGGFYDRTLAAMEKRPRVFGVGYQLAAITTIYPQWHDIPMDRVITEEGPVIPLPSGKAGAP
jgi:5,10-methenyltetrahydrofolate synthetase